MSLLLTPIQLSLAPRSFASLMVVPTQTSVVIPVRIRFFTFFCLRIKSKSVATKEPLLVDDFLLRSRTTSWFYETSTNTVKYPTRIGTHSDTLECLTGELPVPWCCTIMSQVEALLMVSRLQLRNQIPARFTPHLK